MSDSTTTPSTAESRIEQLRLRFGFFVAMLGLAVITILTLVAMRWTVHAADVSTVVSGLTGLVGTIVGAFVGAQVGSAGRDQAEHARQTAETRAMQFAAALPPESAAQLLKTPAA